VTYSAPPDSPLHEKWTTNRHRPIPFRYFPPHGLSESCAVDPGVLSSTQGYFPIPNSPQNGRSFAADDRSLGFVVIRRYPKSLPASTNEQISQKPGELHLQCAAKWNVVRFILRLISNSKVKGYLQNPWWQRLNLKLLEAHVSGSGVTLCCRVVFSRSLRESIKSIKNLTRF
jgi:hypothetical protein